MRPDIFTAVVGIVVPVRIHFIFNVGINANTSQYIPASGPFTPAEHLVQVLPKLAYQVYFDTKAEEAVAELDRDIRRSIRATLRTVNSPPPDAYLRSTESFLGAYSDLEEVCTMLPITFLSSH